MILLAKSRMPPKRLRSTSEVPLKWRRKWRREKMKNAGRENEGRRGTRRDSERMPGARDKASQQRIQEQTIKEGRRSRVQIRFGRNRQSLRIVSALIRVKE
jgi:hypothetical protein